jgi:hypothetical protein
VVAIDELQERNVDGLAALSLFDADLNGLRLLEDYQAEKSGLAKTT